MSNLTQRNIPFSPPDISEEEINAVVETLKSGWITTGPKTKEFERRIADYIGVEKSVCLNSATAAMEMTLRVLGVGPGDEVITSAYTYTASASIIEHVGAKIVLIDTAPGSYEMDYEQLKDAINENTKVIIPVDIAGRLCDYKEIYKIIEEKEELFQPKNKLQEAFNRVIIMADSAHGFGAKQNELLSGQIADFTCFSFHAVKNLTTAEGGAVVWRNIPNIDNDWLYNQYMLYSLHGQSKDALEKSRGGSWEYDIVYPGYKCNMTDLMSSIGLVQLSRYDKLLEKRKSIIEKYNKGLDSLNIDILNHYEKDSFSSGHLYLVRIHDISEKERNNIILEMAKKGIACNVHYKPLPMFTAYKKLGFNIEDFPNSFKQYKNQISLPLHTKLSDNDIEYVIDKFKKIIKI